MAHDRVWEKLAGPGEALCAEFQAQFRDYLDGKLDGNRRLLMEDHLSRCPKCRAESRLTERRTDRLQSCRCAALPAGRDGEHGQPQRP